MYQILLIDPPWDRKKGGIRNGAGKKTERLLKNRNLDYKTLSLSEIKEILRTDILPLGDPQHCVFVWTIDKYLIECSEMFSDFGYRLHARMIWDKGNGFPAAFTVRYSHEYLLWYYMGDLLKIAEVERGKISTVFRGKQREHSRKPDEAYAIINRLYPTQSKIDVFSREKRDGWDQWGDQCDYFRQ